LFLVNQIRNKKLDDDSYEFDDSDEENFPKKDSVTLPIAKPVLKLQPRKLSFSNSVSAGIGMGKLDARIKIPSFANGITAVDGQKNKDDICHEATPSKLPNNNFEFLTPRIQLPRNGHGMSYSLGQFNTIGKIKQANYPNKPQ
jgi:hypothetical protein